jgi:hypothetical protein
MQLHPRLTRELKTMAAMVKIYCRDHHHCENKAICDECTTLLTYALKRLSCCPFQENKPTCGNCTIHCYKKDMQARVREIMRYSGPKMLWNHPLMALQHLFDSRKKQRPTHKRA